MHLYALDNQGKIIPVHKASKQQDYYCFECAGAVRLRSGKQRTPHFYHLKPPSNCRQNGKSLTHLQIQLHIQSILPSCDCQLEYHFPLIKRIADVVWFSKKLIFEVQCSNILPDEIMTRNSDYGSLGYQVIWVLHDLKFNQWKISAVEYSLQKFPHYYTNINDEGQGCIYDQFYLIHSGTRAERQQILHINLNQPLMHDFSPQNKIYTFPPIINDRLSYWPIHFKGDLLDQDLENLKLPLTDNFEKNNPSNLLYYIKKLLFHCIIRPYDCIFKMLLEKACK
jgi:competence protein CoiA